MADEIAMSGGCGTGMTDPAAADADATAALPAIAGLESYWARKTRRAPPDEGSRQPADRILLDTFGIGIEQMHEYCRAAPDFGAFCDWIAATAGPPDPERLARYHAWLAGDPPPPTTARRIQAIE